MPITDDEFDEIAETGASTEDDADRVLDFLLRNSETAYTQDEIVEETGVPDERVGPALVRLKEHRSVEREGDCWRVTDHELAVRAGTALTAEAARQYDDGESFDVEKWAEYAVDEADLERGGTE